MNPPDPMAGIGTDLLGVIAVGIAAAAVLFAGRHAISRAGITLPRWALPAGIGAAMVIYSVWSDYSWFGRAQAGLSDSASVVTTGTDRLPWAPWTYAFPVVTRFAVLDPAETVPRDDGTQDARLLLIERRGNAMALNVGLDCTNGRIRPPGQQDWQPAASDDPVFRAGCAGTGAGT